MHADIIPYWIFVVWLDVVTYLHHHGSSDANEKLPWYRGEVGAGHLFGDCREGLLWAMRFCGFAEVVPWRGGRRVPCWGVVAWGDAV